MKILPYLLIVCAMIAGLTGNWLWGMLFMELGAFLTFAVDKMAACQDWQRVPEKSLLLLAFLGGAAGAAAAMVLFHHKTSKPGIYVPVIAFLLLQTGLAGLYFYRCVLY